MLFARKNIPGNGCRIRTMESRAPSALQAHLAFLGALFYMFANISHIICSQFSTLSGKKKWNIDGLPAIFGPGASASFGTYSSAAQGRYQCRWERNPLWGRVALWSRTQCSTGVLKWISQVGLWTRASQKISRAEASSMELGNMFVRVKPTLATS